MIRVIVNSKDLELGDSSISFTFHNPLFDDEIFDREYSYSFSIPASSSNNIIILNSNRIDTTVRNLEFPAQIYINGILFIDGKIVIKNYNNNSYSCYVVGAGMNLKDEFGKKILSGLELEDIIISSQTTPTDIIDDWQDHMNQILLEDIKDLKYCFPQLKVGLPFANINVTSPYEVDENRSILTYNPSWNGTFNKYDKNNNTYYKPTPTAIKVPGPYSAIPFVMLRYLLIKIFEENGVINIRGGKFFESEAFYKLCVFQMKTLDNLIYSGGNWYNVYPSIFNIKNYLPNLGLVEFIEGVVDNFNFIFLTENKNLYITTATELLQTQEEDLTNLFNEDYKFKWYNKGGGYITTYETDEEERYLPIFGFNTNFLTSSNQQRLVTDYTNGLPPSYQVAGQNFPDGDDEIKLNCLPVVNHSDGGIWDELYTRRLCISTIDSGEPENVNMLRLTNYIGLNPVSNSPMATAFNYILNTDTSVKNHIDAVNLSINDDNGIHANFYEEYLNLLNKSKVVTKVGSIDATKIKKLLNWRRPIKRILQDKGYVKAYVKTVKFSVSTKGLSNVQVDFLTV